MSPERHPVGKLLNSMSGKEDLKKIIEDLEHTLVGLSISEFSELRSTLVDYLDQLRKEGYQRFYVARESDIRIGRGPKDGVTPEIIIDSSLVSRGPKIILSALQDDRRISWTLTNDGTEDIFLKRKNENPEVVQKSAPFYLVNQDVFYIETAFDTNALEVKCCINGETILIGIKV